MATYHEFDQKAVDAALEAANRHYRGKLEGQAGAVDPADDGHLCISAACISVTVENGRVCIKLPLGLGNVCLPIPAIFPDGTVAEACLSICTTWGIPTGVRVTVSIAGKVIVQKSFGKC